MVGGGGVDRGAVVMTVHYEATLSSEKDAQLVLRAEKTQRDDRAVAGLRESRNIFAYCVHSNIFRGIGAAQQRKHAAAPQQAQERMTAEVSDHLRKQRGNKS